CTVGSPQTTWTCNHNFANPQVTVECFNTDTKPHLIWPDSIEQTDLNTATITFDTAQVGTCLIFNAAALNLTTNLQNAVVQNPAGAQIITGGDLSLINRLNALGGGTFQGNYSHSGLESFASINNVEYVDGVVNACSPAGLQLAINAVGAAGIVDARGCETPTGNITATITIPANVTVLLGPSTWTCAVSSGIPCWSLTGNSAK